MRKTLSYIVLGITACVGLFSIFQMNNVTSVLAQYNKEDREAGWDSQINGEYDDGAIEPEPADFAEPTME